jgi:hypothetical protein
MSDNGTKVYGASDDLIEFDGDVGGEVGCYNTDADDHPGVMVVFSDGTILIVKYGKAKMAIWQVTVFKRGELFDRIEECSDEDADPYSDVAFFRPGLKWAFAAKGWEKVE